MLEITTWVKRLPKDKLTDYIRPDRALQVLNLNPATADADGNKTIRLDVKSPLGTAFYISEIDPERVLTERMLAQADLDDAKITIHRLEQRTEELTGELEMALEKNRLYFQALDAIGSRAAHTLYRATTTQLEEFKEEDGCDEDYCAAIQPCGCKKNDKTAERSMDDLRAWKTAMEEQRQRFAESAVCAYPNCDCRPYQWCPSKNMRIFDEN